MDNSSSARADLDQLFAAAYEELRRLAATVQRRDAGHTLSPTALVNEAWLKLSASPDFAAASPLHFKRIAARAMRQLLVEAARRRNAAKRGAGAIRVSFDEALDSPAASPQDLLLLDEALHDLAHLSPRQAAIVELRFFGGLEAAEAANILNISETTVHRDWRAARAWLASQLRRGA